MQAPDPHHKSFIIRLSRLLAKYHPCWLVDQRGVGLDYQTQNPAPDDRMGPPRIHWLEGPCESESGGPSFGFLFECPSDLIGSGSGPIPGGGVPNPELWPLHLSLALALRFRLLGWWARLVWPASLTIDGTLVGSVALSQHHATTVSGEVWVSLGRSTGLRRPPMAGVGLEDGVLPEQLALSCCQGIVAALEAPWPAERMLGYYRDWCATLGECRDVPMPGGGAVRGLAYAIDASGRLRVELPGGAEVVLPVDADHDRPSPH